MKASDIDAIVIHCSATREGQDVRASDIDKWHKEKGWKMIGYNYVIDLDGTIEVGRPLTMAGAHCNTPGLSGKAYNYHSIGICYIGGLESTKDSKGRIVAKKDASGREIKADTRTDAQKVAMHELVYRLMDKYPIVEVLGHRDTYPDKNGDGEITKDEWGKSCPCFEVKDEFPMAVCIAKKK